MLAKKSWMLASTLTTLFLLTIILTSSYVSTLISLGNLQTASALTANNNSTSTSMKLNQTSINATKNSGNNNSTLFLNYDNPFLGIKIQYPSNWLVALHFISGVFITQFISPIQNSTEKFPASVSISI
ncbi:MAG: hypothetical protein WAM14_19840 [Candidatus Nitrosopolaris sp.]